VSINISSLTKIKQDISKYNDVSFMAVTKNRSESDILDLYNHNILLFGENKVQEAKKKFSSLNLKNISLHLIGPLQTNKVKDALNIFDCIQSIDREKLVVEIIKNKKKLSQFKTSDYFIQINIGEEEQKSGVSIKDTKDFYNYCLESKLNIVGLMCIPPNSMNVEKYFNEMKNIKNDINPKLKLSMGMSNDYTIALRCKSNLIRIGSKLFV